MKQTTPEIINMTIGLSKEDQDRIAQLRDKNFKKRDSLWKVVQTSISEFIRSTQKINAKEKATFFQLLSVMINAGVPLIRSLYVLADQTKHPRFKGIIRTLAKKMEEGERLSTAMAGFESIFSEAERGMIASGEASGNLGGILVDLANDAIKSAQIIAKVRNAMIYPAVIVLIMIASIIIMLTLVVPKLTELFEGSGSELPFTTQTLLSLSEWAKVGWPFLIGLAAMAVGAVYFMRQRKEGRFVIDNFILHIPVFGLIIKKLMLARFARMLSSLMSAGIPIVRALNIDAKALGSEVYRQRIHFAAQDVAQGIPLGENLQDNDFLFPPMVSSMVLVGEQTANLAEVSDKIAMHYENEVDNAVESLSKVIEPVILVVMGLVVGFIVAAVMQPIIAVSDLTSVF